MRFLLSNVKVFARCARNDGAGAILARAGSAPGRVRRGRRRGTASILMRATADQSDRIEKPVYLTSISFDRGSAVDHETMSRVADRVLSNLGLTEHQTLMVAHRDREQPHVHMMLNRAHPETGRAWRPGPREYAWTP
ncbi:MAG: relaxase/mobilization nuclease domain-containing protein [Longimicrobiales bacterium]